MKSIFNGSLILALLGCNHKDSVSAKGQTSQHIEVPSSPTPSLERAKPRPTLQILPEDLTTSVRTMPLTLLVAGEVNAEEAEQITHALSIVRWPDRHPVEASHRMEPRDESAGRIVHRFMVVPAKPLAAGWYAGVVDLTVLPARFAAQTDAAASPWPQHLVSRFAPHRTTILTDIRTESVDGDTRLTLRFSARVRDQRSAESIVLISNELQAASCKSEDDAPLHSEDGTYEVSLRCNGGLFPLHVHVDPRLRSLDGVMLAEAYGGPAEVDVPEDPANRRGALTRTLGLDSDRIH